MTLMVRYLAIIGMRIIDVFRMFDAENRGYVQKEQFMKGLKVSLVQFTVFFFNYWPGTWKYCMH